MIDSSAKSLGKYHSSWRYLARLIIQSIILRPFLRVVLSIKLGGLKNFANIDCRKPFIIMPNHQSHFDAPLIIGTMPRGLAARVATGAATDNFFRNWLQSKPTRLLVNTYPIDRDDSHRHQGISTRMIESNVPILVFPEGTRTRTGQLGDFHEGLAHISIATGAPIVPVAIAGSMQAWPAGKRIWRWGRPKVRVTYLAPIYPDQDETADHLTARVKSAIANSLSSL